METGKVFIGTPPRLSKPPCVYVYTVVIQIIYEWHAEARGGGSSLQLKTEKVGGVLTPFISKKWAQVIIF